MQRVHVKGQLEADSLGQGGWSEQGEFSYGGCLFPFIYQEVGLWVRRGKLCSVICGSKEEEKG